MRVRLLLIVACLGCGTTALAETVDEVRSLLLQGRYEDCIRTAQDALNSNRDVENFATLKAQAECLTGKYEAAYDTLLSALTQQPTSLRLRWQLVTVAPYAHHEQEVPLRQLECHQLIRSQSWRYSQKAEDLVVLAEIVMKEGADPRQVQTTLLKRAQSLHPDSRVPVLAMGRLALEKRDLALAAEHFRKGLEKHPADPEFLYGLACALEESSPQESQRLLQQLLQINPRQVDVLLMQAERLIDAERYQDATSALDSILQINPRQPVALAYQSALAFLKDDLKQFEERRNLALSTWKANPEVDHQLGRKLSQKYRFVDGAAAQRRALTLQPDFLPAMRQLAQDLLRLGQEEEGWELAHAAFEKDQYDVSTYNLVTLHDELNRYTVIELPGWRIRMEKQEAELYGQRVVNLLTEARERLCRNYELELQQTIFVEIFPNPGDFAVRTFGMPGAGGYLGVCFGDVVTALSPAARESSPVNWESVLWHEMAHVITLNKTHNRMPRWLSEGISVYEERQRDSRWGERMTPAYRDCILNGKMTPISRMSEAFLPPGNSCGIMFAYYQSSLVVEYIVEIYGHPALIAILDDLGVGMPINDAIERHTTALPELEDEFTRAMTLKAQYYGWYVDWSPVKLERFTSQPDPTQAILDWAEQNPRHYTGLKSGAQILLRMGKKEQARELLEQAVSVYALESGAESALALLSQLQRESGDHDAERVTLRQWTEVDDDAATGLARLIELEVQQENWLEVIEQAERLLEIKPLIPTPYLALATAAENLTTPEIAIPALRTLLKLPVSDAAGLHYRLARQFNETGEQDDARRQTLQALEFAPRYRAALELLLKLTAGAGEANADQNVEATPVTPGQ